MRVTPGLDTTLVIPIKDDGGVEREPDIAFNGTNYMAVWSEGDFGGMHTVRAARVTIEGAVLDSGIPFGKDSYLEYRPGIAFGGGRWLAIWYTYSEPYGIFARFLNNEGQPDGEAFDITTSPYGHFYEPDIASVGAHFLVIWNEQTTYTADDVLGMVVDSTGAAVTGVIPIATGPGFQSRPRVSGGDEFLVVWDDNGQVHGQRISAGGQLAGSSFEISDPTAADRQSADVALGTPNCMAVWMQYNAGSYDIFGNLDTPARIDQVDTQAVRVQRTWPTIVSGPLRRYVRTEDAVLYDVSGRMVTGEPGTPGIYFLVESRNGITKFIKVR